MSAVDVVIARLSQVRQRGKGWAARCPAHDDKGPSLSINEGDDGRVLLHCFAGCAAAGVVAALGLTLAHLFPQRIADTSPAGRRAARAACQQSAWAAALGVLARESSIVLAVANVVARDVLTAEDSARLALAVDRIQSAREVLA